MADIEISVVGQGVGGTMTLKLDWHLLGGLFAEATSDQQGDFLDAVQTGFGDFENTAAELMQMARIADYIPVQSRVAMRNWLQRMADALGDEPTPRTPDGTVVPEGAVNRAAQMFYEATSLSPDIVYASMFAKPTIATGIRAAFASVGIEVSDA